MRSNRRETKLTSAFLAAAIAAMIGIVTGCAAAATPQKGENPTPANPASSTATSAAGAIQMLPARPVPIVHRPPGLSLARRVPLVVALYGADGCPRCMESLTGFDTVANQHGFVVAYPGALTSPPWNDPGDIGYLRAFIHNVTKAQNIDPLRVYVVGFSAGGRMVYTVGCALSSRVAGIASVSGVMRSFSCPLTHPVSELTIVGSTETNAVYGTPSGILSASATASGWRARNSCPTDARARVVPVGPVIQQTWDRCADGSAVALDIVQGGKHLWPGMGGLASSNPDAGFSASQAIWSFFAAHPARSLTRPDATLSSLKVRAKRRLVPTFNLREPVSVRLALVRSRTLASKSFRLFSGARVALTFTVPPNVPRGTYLVQLRIRDAYGRAISFVRHIHL